MKNWLKRIAIASMLAILLLLQFVSPVFAIAPPSTAPYISFIYAFQHYAESGDQLYLVGYNWSYSGTYPDDYPTEIASIAAIVRFMDTDSTTELTNTVPYNYYRRGYGSGLAVIYFSAADAPTWNQAYTLRLEGNPTLIWTGTGRPNVSQSSFDNWSTSTGTSATAIELWARIVNIAIDLGVLWSTDLVENMGGSYYLTDYGEAYFPNIIPNMYTLLPKAFPSQATKAEFDRVEKGTTFADNLRSGITGTIFDWTDIETAIGLPATLLISVAYMVVCAIGVFFCLQRVNSYKPAVLLMIIPVLVGAKLGILPMMGAIMLGVGSSVLTVWALLFDRSSG